MLGFLREYLNVHPFYLNLRYAHEEEPYLKWLNRPLQLEQGLPDLPLPYLFARVDTMKEGWKALALGLWKKTVRVHHKNSSENKQ